MQMYQTNFTNSQLAQYNMALNQLSGHSMSSQDKKRNTNKMQNKSNNNKLNNLNQKQMQMLHNMQLNSNSFVNQENWTEEGMNNSETGNLIAEQYKMSNNKIKMGAA